MKVVDKLANILFEEFKMNGAESAQNLFELLNNEYKLTVCEAGAVINSFQILHKEHMK